MPTYLSPRISVIEQPPGIRSIDGVATNIAGEVGLAEKGPIGVPTPVFGPQDFVQKFGGPVSYALLYWVVMGFFQMAGEGATMYIVRTCHYTDNTDPTTLTAVKASVVLDDRGGSTDTLTVRALSEGTWANTLQVTAALSSRFNTTLNNGAVVANGATSFIVTSAAGMHRGTVLELADGVDTVRCKVEKVENLTVYLQSAIVLGGGATIADGGTVTQLAFDLEIYQSGELVESWPYLSMEDTDPDDYAETRVNGNSQWISVEDEDSSAGAGQDRPEDTALAYLSGGADGLSSLAASDYVGSLSGKTGLYAFDSVDTLSMFGVCESQSVTVQLGIMDYAEYRNWTVGVLNSPLGLDEADTIDHITDDLSANTSRSVFYYKQVKIMDQAGKAKVIPADGHIMGAWARNDTINGPSVVAAGERGLLRGIVGLENTYAESESARNLMYPERINFIINHPALGRCLFGSRTLDRTGGIGGQINERRFFNFVAQSLWNGLHWVLFLNNTPETRKAVERTVTAFLAPFKRSGELEDFYVICNEDLNNAVVRAQNKLICQVGLKVPDTIEFFDIPITRDTRAQEAALQALLAS